MTNHDTNPPQRFPAWLAALRRLLARITDDPPPPPFTARYRPGIYTVGSAPSVDALARQAAISGLSVTRLDLNGISSKEGFLAAAARDLSFPDYFGHNWDAFADCLGDVAAGSANGTVLILEQFAGLARAAPREWPIALTILKRAVTERIETDRPLYVLLHGPRGAAPDIPALDVTRR